MSNLTLTIPNPSNYLSDNSRSIAIAAVLIVAGVLATVAVEFYRRHYSAKKQEQLAKKWVAVWLTASSGIFTAIGYLVFLIQSNTSLFSTLPFVGKHVAAVVGVGYFLYNVRLNRWYKAAAERLSRWTGTKVTDAPAPETTPVVGVQEETAANFVA